MTTKSKQLVRAGHELASELKADCGAVDVRSVANLLTELASALDVQTARSDALAAELARYSMPAGEADQRMAESRAVRQALGFGQDVNDVAPVDLVERINALAAERDAVNADNAYLRDQVLCWARECDRITYTYTNKVTDAHQSEAEQELANTLPETDAWVNEQRATARMQGAYFVANRMLAAWDAGFIDDTAKNAADIARMILTSTEFMRDAPEGDFSRSFADGVLSDIAAQLRGGQV